MVIPGNRYPPPPVFLRGGYAHTRKFIIDHQEIHTPPYRKSIPPSPSFPGGGVRISYTRRGGMAVLEQYLIIKKLINDESKHNESLNSLIISLKNQFISANISLHSNRIIYLIDINIYKLFLYIFSNNRLLKNWIFNY